MSDDDAKRSSREDTEAKGKKQRRLEVSAKRVTGSSKKKRRFPKAQDASPGEQQKRVNECRNEREACLWTKLEGNVCGGMGFRAYKYFAGTEQPRGP